MCKSENVATNSRDKGSWQTFAHALRCPECVLFKSKSIECPICGSVGPGDCGHCEQVVNWGKSAVFETAEQCDGAGALRMQFRTNGKPVFSISPDNKITLHNDTELDEASRLFWEAVKFITPGTLLVKVDDEPEIACAGCGGLPSRDGNKCTFIEVSARWDCNTIRIKELRRRAGGRRPQRRRVNHRQGA